MRLIRFALIALFLAGMACAQGPDTSKKADEAKQIPSFDPAALDRSADPCVDFYQFSCGGWVKNNPVPSDQALWGRFNELAERNRAILREILETDAKPGPRSPNDQKIGDYYATCMNEDAINKKGAAVLKPYFGRIDAIKSKSQLPGVIAYLHSQGIDVLFGFGSGPDFKNAKEVIAQADQGGLSLPERDYYLKNDPKSVELQKGYLEHVTNMFKLLGDSQQKAAAEANAVMNVETALAKGSMEIVKRREPANVYHKMSEKEWQSLAPSISLTKYLTSLGVPPVNNLNVAVPEFFKALDAELKEASLDDLKAYLRWHLVHSQAGALSKTFVDENFNFFGKALTGARELRARWKRCVANVDADLGEALGQAYVAKTFPPEAKARTLKMVQALEAALRQDIQNLSWMTDTTKKQALIKLQGIENKIGYPNKWRDYTTLKIVRGDK